MHTTINYLYSLQFYGMKFGLRNIRSLLRSVGNPHKRIKTIHVAGTNGKGSTSSMIAAILSAAGYKVGLYTSPHLVKFNERIRINGRMISDAQLIRYTRRLKPAIRKHSATFFEATTAIAFKHFADNHVDVAVIETGLGGRLDATNVITPLVSVITSIGLDHTEQLGKTLSKIAGEKAGIIKSRVPVVIGNIGGQSRTIILRRSREMRAPLVEARTMKLPQDIALDLKGSHQLSNAACAVSAVALIGRHFLIGDAAVRQGLSHTSALTGLRARFELIPSRPMLILDVAHNPDGMKTLVKELRSVKGKKTILFGVMKDKNYGSMLKELKKLHAPFVFTQPEGKRSLSSAALYTISKRLGVTSFVSNTVSEGVAAAQSKTPESGVVIVTGSHYLVGEVMSYLKL